MKTFLFLCIFALMSITMLFTSCSDDDDLILILGGTGIPTYITPGTTDLYGNYAITFGGYSQTRSSYAGQYNYSAGYDAFKLFAWKENGTSVMNPFIVQKSAQGWAYTNIGEQTTLYYDKSQAYYNFIAVISDKTPTSTVANTVKLEGVESFLAEDNTVIDKELLHATVNVPASKYAIGMTVPFVHDNAIVRFKFYSDDADTKLVNFKPAESRKTTNNATIISYTTNVNYSTVSSILTQEMIDEINSHSVIKYNGIVLDPPYNYGTGRTVEIDETFDAWNYIETHCPGLLTTLCNAAGSNLNSAYASNPRHNIAKIFVDNNILKFVTFNINSWSSSTVPGIDGIVVLPATSVNNDGSDAIRSTICKTADVTITNSDILFTQTSTDNSLVYSLPASGNVGTTATNAISSPTNFYAIPTNTANNGMTLKISYTYKDVTVYDSRVYIPANNCQWEAGKVYIYTIKITGIGNGSTDPGDVDETDPEVNNTQLEIGSGLNLINVTVTDYTPEDVGEYEM